MADTDGWASVEEPTKVCQRARGGHPVPVPGTSSGLSAEDVQTSRPEGALPSLPRLSNADRAGSFSPPILRSSRCGHHRSTLLEEGGPGPQKASCSPGSRPLQGAMPFPGTSKNTPHTSARPGPAFTCPPLGQGPRLPSCRTRRSGPNLSKTPVVLAQGREVQPWQLPPGVVAGKRVPKASLPSRASGRHTGGVRCTEQDGEGVLFSVPPGQEASLEGGQEEAGRPAGSPTELL